MKPLFFCNTYYQLIVAIQMKLTIFRNEDVGVCLTDHSVGAKQVSSRLRTLGLFKDVFYWPNRLALRGMAGIKKIKKLIEVNRTPRKKGRFGSYDALIFFNISYAVYEIENELRTEVSSPKLFRMEEGLATCCYKGNHDWRSSLQLRLLDDCRTISRLPRISQKVEGFYCFIPELCGDDFPLEPLLIPSPTHNRSELCEVLTSVFDYKGFDYPQKYIFFASSRDIDGDSTGETELVLKLASIVGPENLLVKMHPRDRRNVYQNAGIAVMERTGVPWEVVQMSEDFSTRTLLSSTSGSPLAVTALMNDRITGYYIKPISLRDEHIANYDSAMEIVAPVLAKLHDLSLCENIRIVSFEEFVGIVEADCL